MKLPKLFSLSLSSFLLLGIYSSQSFAAACCGGGFALPSIITGDDKAQLTTSYSYSALHTRVQSDGVWRRQQDSDLTQTLRIEGSHIVADRYQVGLSLPLLLKDQAGLTGGNASGLGDAMALVGYEYLPDWNYNPWRPKGIGFLTLTAPTGSSQYDSDTLYTNRGRGFWTIGAGTILTKSWIRWDVLATFELHKRFERTVSNDHFTGAVSPGWGHSTSLGAGYNLRDWRLGASLTWVNEDTITDGGQNIYTFASERYTTGSLLASYTFQQNWAGTISYSDQTLFGDPTNTTLSKSVGVMIQKRWSR